MRKYTAHRIGSKRVHIVRNDRTLCGLWLSRDWMVEEEEPNCPKCLGISQLTERMEEAGFKAYMGAGE